MSETPEEKIARLERALHAAEGYLLNAIIDLQTGAPKKTALATMEGGLRMLRAVERGEAP